MFNESITMSKVNSLVDDEKIPLAKPEITDEDREAVLGVLRTSSLSTGPRVAEFERALCAFLSIPHAVVVNSGTSALHLAAKVLRLPPGAEVILPSFAFAAPLNVLLQERLQPVFVDIDPKTLNTTPELIEAAITSRTKAIVAIHTFGRPLAMGAIQTVARRHGLFIIEDACEALGAEIDGGKAGTFGDVGIFAFYPNKQITTGEGGALVSARSDLTNHARKLRNQGREGAFDWFQQAEVGYSYRLSDLNCALGASQLARIDSIIERRLAVALAYDAKLQDFGEIQRPGVISPGTISWFCYVVQLTENFDRKDRDWLVARLNQKNVGAGRYFAPLHRQPVLGSRAGTFVLPATDSVADRVLALPFFNQLNGSQIDRVCRILKESLDELSRQKM